MTKEEIVQGITDALKQDETKARNSMGVSEMFYNEFYLAGMFLTDYKEKSLEESGMSDMTEKELNRLIEFAEFAAEAFY